MAWNASKSPLAIISTGTNICLAFNANFQEYICNLQVIKVTMKLLFVIFKNISMYIIIDMHLQRAISILMCQVRLNFINIVYLPGLSFVRTKLVLDGTVDKTWFKPVKTGQTGQNLREVINHSNGCRTIEDG